MSAGSATWIMIGLLGRGISLFFGLFALANLIGDWLRSGYDASILDPGDLNTAMTVRNVADAMAPDTGRVLAVSHSYYLPRIKLAFDRAGMRAYTVPAREQYVLSKMPWLMAREIAAFWAYFLIP